MLRRVLLALIVFLPLCTLAHRDDLGRWERQRSAMAGPDEFSYLLMADHFLQGGGLSLKASIGLDTFYPPGYPLLLAGFSKLTGFIAPDLTAFKAHLLNALLLCCDTFLAYVIARRLLLALGDSAIHRRFAWTQTQARWLALLIAGAFATNWHVLECSLLIMSEPAFMLILFAWLALAMQWPAWPRHPGRAAVMGLLAVGAWSVRGAGIVCVAVCVGYIFMDWPLLRYWRRRTPAAAGERKPLQPLVFSLLIVVSLAMSYQASIAAFSPEKSLLTAKDSANSYPKQLLHGLTDGGRLSVFRVRDWPGLTNNLGGLLGAHMDDFGASFVPWPREDPDMEFRVFIGKCLVFLALIGWVARRVISPWRRRGALDFVDLLVGFYLGLYLIWPFDFARFWSPLLPVALVFVVDALMLCMERPGRMSGALVPMVVLILLTALNAEELFLQLGHYARRLNYVSDSLADGAAVIVHRCPDPSEAIVTVEDGDTHFALAWYLSRATPGSEKGREYAVRSPADGEKAEAFLRRSLREAAREPGGRVYFFNYFTQAYALGTLSGLASTEAAGFAEEEIHKVYQKEIIATLWEIVPRESLPRARSSSAATKAHETLVNTE